MASIFSTQAADNFTGMCALACIQSGIEDVGAAFAAWRSRTARRRAAIRIDDRTLADIGLLRAQVDHEAGKPFWKA